MTSAATFGGRLAQARRFHGLSQDDMGGLVDVKRRTVWSWEHDQTSPTIEQFLRWVSHTPAFDVAWYLGGLVPDPTDGGGQESVTRRELATVTQLRPPTTTLSRVA